VGGGGGGLGRRALAKHVKPSQRNCQAYCLRCLCPPPLRSTEGVRSLAARAAQACFLLRVLTEHNIGRLAARLDEGPRTALRALRFRCADRPRRGLRVGSRRRAGKHVCEWCSCVPQDCWAAVDLLQSATVLVCLAPAVPPTHAHPPPQTHTHTHTHVPHSPCRELVASEEGMNVATQLISVLVAQHLLSTGAARPGGPPGGGRRRAGHIAAACAQPDCTCGSAAHRRSAYAPTLSGLPRCDVYLAFLLQPPHPLTHAMQAAWPRTWRPPCSAARAPTSARTTSCTPRPAACCSALRRRQRRVGG
jgi:hypothetical protein